MLVIRNTPSIRERASEIVVRGGLISLVDPRNFHWLNSFSWFPLKSASTVYVCTRKIVKGRTLTVRMHRLILNAPDWMKVHHINHNSFDNRRENLMLLTERQHRHFDGWHYFNRQ